MLAEQKKDKALKLLKRKKAIEKRYNHCETNIENIQGLIDQIKETQQQQDILKALDGGNQAMKELHKIVSVDDAERLVFIFTEFFVASYCLEMHQSIIHKILAIILSIGRTNGVL